MVRTIIPLGVLLELLRAGKDPLEVWKQAENVGRDGALAGTRARATRGVRHFLKTHPEECRLFWSGLRWYLRPFFWLLLLSPFRSWLGLEMTWVQNLLACSSDSEYQAAVNEYMHNRREHHPTAHVLRFGLSRTRLKGYPLRAFRELRRAPGTPMAWACFLREENPPSLD